MSVSFTPSALAQARKRLYGASGKTSSQGTGSDLARIEQDAYDEQARKMKDAEKAREDAAEAQRKADEATDKAAAKAAKATADAAQRAENNALEEQYRRDRRPMYVDADSRIKPIHTDAEWAKQKAEKGRKLQAEKDKKQAEDRTKAELGKVEADQGVLAENDQTIQRATQREELERKQKRQQLQRIQKEFEDKLKAYDDGTLDLTPTQATAAAGTVALAKQRLADLDTAAVERDQTALDFATQQDVRKAALKKQEAAVRRGEMPEAEKTVAEGRSAPLTVVDGGTKPFITDPAQFEAAAQQHAAEVQAFDAEQAAQQQKLEALKVKNARLMSMPHAAADVSSDGQWHRDLIPEVNALGQAVQSKAPAWQAQQAKMAAQAETLNASAQAINEKARVENDKAKAQQQKDRAAAYQQLNALPGTSKLGDELKAVHDAVDQHRGGDDAGLMEWADKETERIQAAAKMPLEREREKVYQELNAVPGAKGVGDELAKLDAEVEPHLGGDDAGVKEYYEQRRKEILGKVQQGSKQAQEATNAIYGKLADQLFEQNVHEPWWARTTEKRIEGDPDKLLTAYATTTTAQEQVAFEQAVDELTQKLGGKAEVKGVMGTPVRSPERQQAINLLRDARANDWSSGDTETPVRYDSKGTILVNPSHYLDETAYKAAVEAAEGTPEEKAEALKQFPELKQRAAKAQIDTLRTLSVYRDWEATQPAEMSEADKLAKFREENSGVFSTGAWKVRLHQALLGVGSGVVGLAQSAVGTYEAITRSRGAMDAYKALSRDSSQMSEASNALPTGQWVNMGTSMVISTVPSLAVGGVAGAMRQSSLQNAAKTLTLKQVLKGGKGIAGLKTAEQASKAAQAFGLKSAAAAAGLQTFGTMYGNAAEGYMKRGDSEESALNKAFIPALASAATTFLLTAAGGTKGAEALLRQESFRKNFKSWFQAVASGSVQEGLLEEAPDQLMQGMLERYTYNPRKSWNEIAEETLVAGIGGALMGAGFEAMNTRFAAPEGVQSSKSQVSSPATNSQTVTPAENEDGPEWISQRGLERAAESRLAVLREKKAGDAGDLGGQDIPGFPGMKTEARAAKRGWLTPSEQAELDALEKVMADPDNLDHAALAKLYGKKIKSKKQGSTGGQGSQSGAASVSPVGSSPVPAAAPPTSSTGQTSAQIPSIEDDQKTAGETFSSLAARTKGDSEAYDKAQAERTAAAKRIMASLKKGDVIEDTQDSGVGDLVVLSVSKDGKMVFVEGAGDPISHTIFMAGTATDASGKRIDTPASAIRRSKPASSVTASVEASKPERWAAAEAALANFSQTTNLPAEVADKTAQKAQVLLKIAQGAKAESLDNDDLHLVGLHRDDAGKVTQGHMSKNGWKKGPNPNGSPQPVELLNGEFVITDRQIESLRNKDVGLGALADAIALPAAERRAQILAKENANAATPPDPAQVAAVLYDLRSAETGAALDLDEIELALDNAERRLQKGKPMDWPVDRTWLPNVSTASVPALKELLGSSEGIAAMRLRIDELKQQNETPPAAPAPQRGTDEVAAPDARGAGAEAVAAPAPDEAQPGNAPAVGAPAEVLTQPPASQAGGQAPAAADEIPMSGPAAAKAEAGKPSEAAAAEGPAALPLEQAQRATEISRELAQRGLDEATAQAVAAEIVGEQGVVGEIYTVQMTQKAFDAALKARGWESYNAGGKTRYRRVMSEVEQVPGVQSAQRGDKAADEVLAGNAPSKGAKAPPEGGTTSAELTAQMPDSKAVSDLAKQRAPMLARLQGYGVVVRVVKSAKEAAAIVGHKVKSGRRGFAANVNGVPHVILIAPDSNPDLLDTFDHEAIHAADLVFENQNPELAAKADAVLDRASPEFDQELYHFMAQEYDGFADLTLRQKNKEARRAIIEGRWKGKTSSRSKGFRRYLTEFLAHLKKVFTGKKSAALKDAIDNIEFVLGITQQTTAAAEGESHAQVQQKVVGVIEPGTPLSRSKAWIVARKLIAAELTPEESRSLDALQAVLDGRQGEGGYGRLFNAIVLVESTAGGGISVSTVDGKNILAIDVRGFAKRGNLTEEGILVNVVHEIAHALAVSTVSRREAIRRMRVMEQHAPQAVRDWWQSYYALDITQGLRPAQPPLRLTDDDAYTAAHELIRMMFEKETFGGQVFKELLAGADAVTSETVEPVRDLLDWLLDVLRTMGRRLREAMEKLPRSERRAWEQQLEKMRVLYQAALTQQKTLDRLVQELQAEEIAEKQAKKKPVKTAQEPDLEDELAAAADEAFSAEATKPKEKPERTAKQKNSFDHADKLMGKVPGPKAGQTNLVSRILGMGGITRPSAAWLQRKAQEGNSRATVGDWDWLDTTNLNWWEKRLFPRGEGTSIDQELQRLHAEGYFPEAGKPGDVTGEMLHAKIRDVLAAYERMKAGGPVTNDEAYDAYMAEGEMEQKAAETEQRQKFEKATESGPMAVNVAELKVGDMLLIEGERVEVMEVKTLKVPTGEEFDPDANPAQFVDANGVPREVVSVLLKDGKVFGWQQLRGSERIQVDGVKDHREPDYLNSLAEAIHNKTMADDEAVLRFMQHEGMDAATPFGDIISAMNRKLRVPVKRLQKMLMAVFEDVPADNSWSAAEMAATMDSPLASAAKRAPAKPLTSQVADNRAQMDWLNRQAKALGAVDIEELRTRNEKLFDRLAAEWRVKHARDGEGKLVQNEAIRGIFESLYGPETKASWRDDTGTRPRSLATAAEAHTRGMVRAGEAGPASPTAESLRAEKARLIDWARDEKLLLHKLPEQFTPYSPQDHGNMEHHVFYAGDRVLKINHEGHYGIWPVPHLSEFDLRNSASTPLRYLQRVVETNAVLGDDIVLHGVLADRQGNVQIITSQPRYSGSKANDEWSSLSDDSTLDQRNAVFHAGVAAVRQAFAQTGFVPVGSDNRTYYRRSDNTAIFDAHLSNLMWVDADEGRILVPFDVTVMHPTGQLAENFKALVPSVTAEATTDKQSLGSAAKRSFTSNLGDSLKRSAEGIKTGRRGDSETGRIEPDLKRFIDAATRGLSTAYAPLERVFMAAQSVNKSLTEREFGRMISAADAAGQVVLEPAESPATVEKANVFGVRMASGVPAWGVAIAPEVDSEQSSVSSSEPETDYGLPPTDALAHQAATSPRNDLPDPTPAQKEAGNYQKGHVTIAGHEISIENPAGSKRQPEWPALKDHYGYFKGTNAKDGDHVDVFVKPGTPEDYAGPVHVVRQNVVERSAGTPKRIPNENMGSAAFGRWPNASRAWPVGAYGRILKRLAQSPRLSPESQAIAAHLAREVDYSKVELYTGPGGSQIGEYAPPITDKYANNPAMIGYASGEGSADTHTEEILLHEGLHHATLHTLAHPKTADQRAAKAAMAALHAELQSRPGAAQHYGMRRIDDFVAELGANKKFQQWVKRQPGYWQRFVQSLRRLLGLPDRLETALAHLLTLTGDPASQSLPVSKSPAFTATKQFDEYKVMLGYPTAEEARAAYLRNYEPGWPGMQRMTTHTAQEFARIKESVFTVPANRVPGVRESDQVLASGAKRGQSAAMADPDKAAQSNEPSPGGLSEAEWNNLVGAFNAHKAEGGFWLNKPLWTVSEWRDTGDSFYATYLDVLGHEEELRISNHFKPPHHVTNRHFIVDYVGMKDGEVVGDYFQKGIKEAQAELLASKYNLQSIEDVEKAIKDRGFKKPMFDYTQERREPLGYDKWLKEFTDVSWGFGRMSDRSASSIEGWKQSITANSPLSERMPDELRADALALQEVLKKKPLPVFIPVQNKLMGIKSPTSRETLTGRPGVDNSLKQTDVPSRGQSGTIKGSPKSGTTSVSPSAPKVNPESSRAAGGTLGSAAKRSTLDKAAGFIGKTAPTAIASGIAKAGSAIVEKTGIQKPLAALGSNKVDKFIFEHVMKPAVWDRVSSAQEAVKKWLNKPGALNGIGKAVVDQTLPLWNVPREWLAHYHEAQRKAAWGREKAMDVIRALSHDAKVSDLAYPKEYVEDPSWRVRMFDAMEGKTPMTDLPEPLQKLAARLRVLLEETGRDLIQQGLLNLDTFNELKETGWMPRYTEDEAEAAGGSWLKAFKLGIKDMKAQRSTAWHIVDTSRKDPKERDQYAIVSREEGGKKNRWRFRNQQQRNAWYEAFVKREAVRFLQDGGPDVTNLLAALSKDEQAAVRDGIRRLTPEAVDLPGTLIPDLANVVTRAVELQRLRYKKEKPFEPDKLIKDPVYSVARYVMANTHNAATMELLKATAKNKEWVSDVSLEGYTEIPDNPRFGPLAKKFVRQDIATQVLEHVGVDGAGKQFYDSMLRKWKAGKLVLNPGSHVRDAVGNTVFAYLGGNSIWNPGNLPYYRDAITTLRDGGSAYAELVEMQVLGGDAFTTQVQAGLKGLLPDTKTVEDMDPGAIARLFMGFGAGIRGGYEYLSELRKLPDDFYKTAAYLKYKSQGMSAAEAAAEVRKWFPYYDRLGSSGVWKHVSRYYMPFSAFFRESTRIFGRAAMERPMALSTSLAFASMVTRYSLMMLGLGDDDEEAIKRSMRGKLKFSETPLFSMLLPARTDEGQLQQWDISAVMPFADLLGSKVETREDEDTWTRFFRSMMTGSPLTSALYGWGNNVDSFTGKMIVQKDMGTWESTVERVKDLAGDLLPPLTPFVGVHSNTIENAGRRTGSLEMRNRYQSYLRAIVGLDVRSADPNLYTETKHFREQNNLPLNNNGNTYSTPLKSRLAKDIKGELIQDAPDIATIAAAMARLEASGNAVKSPKQMADLLDSLDPAKIIKQEFRRKLINSFSPEAQRVYQSQQREFQKANQRVPSVMVEARKQMQYGAK